jgi:tRNA dimethylallyltransferase
LTSKPLLVIIGGPTAVGKTSVAIKIAQHFNTEIVSADSRQFYQEMSIGTAVPSADELSAVKHHFIQNRSVEQPYNASSYENDAIQLMDNLLHTKNLLVMVGGSGLYIDAVCNGIDDLPSIPVDVRNKFNQIFEQEGIEKIRELLKSVDPIYFSQVDVNNHKRMLKALEVYEITGKPYSSFLSNSEKIRNFKTVKIFLDTERTELYNRINHRVDTMVENGLEEEARSLLPFRTLTPLNTVGYKEFFEYFDGKISRDEAITQIKNHTRAYARRQLTWFRRYTDAHWYKPGQVPEMIELISKSM